MINNTFKFRVFIPQHDLVYLHLVFSKRLRSEVTPYVFNALKLHNANWDPLLSSECSKINWTKLMNQAELVEVIWLVRRANLSQKLFRSKYLCSGNNQHGFIWLFNNKYLLYINCQNKHSVFPNNRTSVSGTFSVCDKSQKILTYQSSATFAGVRVKLDLFPFYFKGKLFVTFIYANKYCICCSFYSLPTRSGRKIVSVMKSRQNRKLRKYINKYIKWGAMMVFEGILCQPPVLVVSRIETINSSCKSVTPSHRN